MTYPQQQFQPQGQWAAPQPPQEQQFAPQPQAPVSPAPYVPATDPSSWQIGTAQDASGSPVKVAHLENRTVVIIPLKTGTTPNPKNPANPSAFVQADVFVLDGPTPFYFGGSPNGNPRIADTMMVNQLPFFAERTVLFGEVLVQQLEGQIGKGIAVGKISKKTTGTGNTPWIITTDPTPEQLQLAHRLIQAQYRERSFPNPVPVMLAGPQAPQYAQQAPGASPYGPMGGYAAPVQAPASPAPQWPQQQPQGAQFQAPAQPAFQPQFQVPAQPVAQERDWRLDVLPPGVPAEQLAAWQSQTTPEQRKGMLDAAGITAPPQAMAQPTGL